MNQYDWQMMIIHISKIISQLIKFALDITINDIPFEKPISFHYANSVNEFINPTHEIS